MRQRLLQQQQAEQHPEPHGESGRSAGLRRGRRGGGFGAGRSPPVQGAGASATGCPQRAAKGSSLREGVGRAPGSSPLPRNSHRLQVVFGLQSHERAGSAGTGGSCAGCISAASQVALQVRVWL